MSNSDPLVAPAGSGVVITYVVNTLFQLDCLVSCLFTGQRNKTISCWLGECQERRFGAGWYWGLIWLWVPVNYVARHCFKQPDHCEQSVGPFTTEEDAP